MSDEDKLSDYAAIKREEIVNEERKKRHDQIIKEIDVIVDESFLISIDASNVIYTIKPQSLPFNQINMRKFISKMHTEYEVGFIDPTQVYRPAAPFDSLSIEDQDRILSQIPSLLISNKIKDITLSNGRYKTKKGTNFVQIPEITFSRESVEVKVLGRSNISEAVIQDSVEYLWEAAGDVRQWSDISKDHQLTRYTTTTKVAFKVDFFGFLNDKLVKFLQDDVQSSDSWCQKMVAIQNQEYYQNKIKPDKPHVFANYNVDSLGLRVSVWNKRTGLNEVAYVKFDITARNEYGTGIIQVITPLDFDDHMKFVGRLIEVLG